MLWLWRRGERCGLAWGCGMERVRWFWGLEGLEVTFLLKEYPLLLFFTFTHPISLVSQPRLARYDVFRAPSLSRRPKSQLLPPFISATPTSPDAH